MKYLTTLAAVMVAGLLGAAQPAAAEEDHIICARESGDVAIEACTRAIDSSKLTRDQLAWAYHNRAVEYEVKKETDKAMADYNHALSIDERRPGSLVGLGNCYLTKGDIDKAIDNYDRSIKLDPKSPNAFQNRCLAYYRKKDFDRAREDCDTALDLTPRDEADRTSQTKARRVLELIRTEQER